jgi:membrane-associated PAP2 superfamily phosphatase
MSRFDRTFWPTLLALGAALAVFEYTSLDLLVQDRLFDFASGAWLVDSTAAGPRLWFYTGPKVAIIGFGVTLLVLAIGPARWRRTLDRRALIVAVATLATVPALVGWGKSVSNIFCPSEVRRYGGDMPYVKLCEPMPDGEERSARRGRCFPAGHASGGYALFGLIGLLRTRRGRLAAAAFALVVGSAMGAYQMAKGAHYLSHTVVTMLLAWWVFLLWRRLLRVSGGGREIEMNRNSSRVHRPFILAE